MKMKISKDIPGYKAGQIVDRIPNSGNYLIYIPGYALNGSGEKHDVIKYPLDNLLDFGFIEFVEDAVDMQELRHDLKIQEWRSTSGGGYGKDKYSEWITAYLVVKAVIEKLNGNEKGNFEIYYVHANRFSCHGGTGPMKQVNILPMIANEETAEKVIELCRPELEVLFGVK